MNAPLDLESHPIPVQDAEADLLKRLGQRLRRAREWRGMSPSEFALHARIDRAALDGIERGDANAAVASLVRILTTLGIVDRFELFGGAVPEAPRNLQAVTATDWPGSPDAGFQPASCSKFRAGFCQEVFVYQAFRPLFGD